VPLTVVAGLLGCSKKLLLRVDSSGPPSRSVSHRYDGAVIKRADNLRPGDEARIYGKWLTLTEILDVHPGLGDGARKTLEVKADKTIVAHFEPGDLIEVREPA
jgi:hypothetical protein